MTSRTGALALTHSLVLQFLADHGYSAAHEALLLEIDAADAPTYVAPATDRVRITHPELDDVEDRVAAATVITDVPPLVAVVEAWRDAQVAEAVARAAVVDDDAELASINRAPTSPSLTLLAPPREAAVFHAHHLQNILVARLLCVPSIDAHQHVLVTAAADRTLRVTRLDRTDIAQVVETGSSPVGMLGSILDLVQLPTLPHMVAVAGMDGSIALVDLRAVLASDPEAVTRAPRRKPHAKLCSVVAVSKDGRFVVSGAADRRVVVTEIDPTSGTWATDAKEAEWSVPGAVESLTVLPDGRTVLIAARNAADLWFGVIPDGKAHSGTFYARALNANPNDTHVSWTPMHLAVSPSGSYVLAATSAASGRVVLLRLSQENDGAYTVRHVRNFYGAKVDEWSKPRVAWVGSDAYFAVTSGDHQVYVYAVRAKSVHTTNVQIVAQLTGHEHVVRDLACVGKWLVSGSYDKSVRVWQVLP
ncbi:hypothetical protein GGF31_005621 [Allomyces arbusculus]|nr:hypothetical protein GGF31_005621 [Allomyces arbusculus]